MSLTFTDRATISPLSPTDVRFPKALWMGSSVHDGDASGGSYGAYLLLRDIANFGSLDLYSFEAFQLSFSAAATVAIIGVEGVEESFLNPAGWWSWPVQGIAEPTSGLCGVPPSEARLHLPPFRGRRTQSVPLDISAYLANPGLNKSVYFSGWGWIWDGACTLAGGPLWPK